MKRITEKKQILIRTIVWAGIIIATFWVANFVDKPIKYKKAMNTTQTLKTEFNKIWLNQVVQTDTINEIAQDLIKTKNLQPGASLPPEEIKKAFLQKNSNGPNPSHLNTQTPVYLKNWHIISNGVLETPVECILTVRSKVPKPGQPYAATAIFGNPDIVDGGMQIHPKTASAKAMINITIKQTGELGILPKEKVAKNNKPNP